MTHRQIFKFEGCFNGIVVIASGEVPLPICGLNAGFGEAKRMIEKQFPGIVLSRLELVGPPSAVNVMEPVRHLPVS